MNKPTSVPDTWQRIAAPLPERAIQWRQDGKIISRDGRYFARFVAYVDAQYVRERLDEVVPGEWDLVLVETLPPIGSGEDGVPEFAFKARLQILGVIREDIGQGRDYKSASTDAFKRAAVRFGIASELYSLEANWVEMDGDGRYAKPLMDPAEAYAKRYRTRVGVPDDESRDEAQQQEDAPRRAAAPRKQAARRQQAAAPAAPAAETGDAPQTQAEKFQAEADAAKCPECGGPCWDNRLTKRNPKAPDFKCKDRNCEGVIWPPREGSDSSNGNGRKPAEAAAAPAFKGDPGDSSLPWEDDGSGLPF